MKERAEPRKLSRFLAEVLSRNEYFHVYTQLGLSEQTLLASGLMNQLWKLNGVRPGPTGPPFEGY